MQYWSKDGQWYNALEESFKCAAPRAKLREKMHFLERCWFYYLTSMSCSLDLGAVHKVSNAIRGGGVRQKVTLVYKPI